MSAPASSSADGTSAASSTAPPSLFVVLGCTGAGKSALAVAVARRYNAEVLSADSIQVYAGLPLASNQLTAEEAQGVRHHMLAVLPPHRAMHVRQFRRAARALIADAFSRGRSVVVVGGTFYWVESILYKNIMGMEEEEDGAAGDEDGAESDAEGAEGTATASPAAAEGKAGERMQVEHSQPSQPQPQSHAEAQQPFTMPADAPLTLEALLSLTDASVPQLTLEHLAFACSVLLSRMEAPSALAPHAPAAAALLRHLSRGLSAQEFQQLLARMPPEDVRCARFVANILAPLSLDTQAAAGAAVSSSASVAASAAAPSAGAGAGAGIPAAPMFPSAHVYELVVLVDPSVGQKLHPRDERKLRRALAIFVEQGGRATMSELIARTGGPRGRAGLQYRVQALWVDCAPAVLEARLDSRVDAMVRGGLLREAEGMYRHLWLRQQRLARGEAAEEPWEYRAELDADCAVCATVESRDVSLPPPPAAAASFATATAAAVSSAAASTAATPADGASAAPSAASPEYLGPTELHMDWERGIGQALGLKEFRPYFKLKFHTLPEEFGKDGASASVSASSSATPPRSKRQKTAAATAAPLDPAAAAAAARDAALQTCFDACVLSLKQRTRAYARVQLRWIKTRFWPGSVATLPDPAAAAADSAAPSAAPAPLDDGALSILRLDASGAADAAVWEREVVAPALEVCDQFMSGRRVDLRPYAALSARLPALPAAASAAVSASAGAAVGVADGAPVAWTKQRCEACDVVCNGPLEWSKHQSSKRHRTASTRTQRKQLQMERMEEVQRARLEKKEAAAAAAAAAAGLSGASPSS
jgi:tRNA A37 N6-isopentenylltransferase MiaA